MPRYIITQAHIKLDLGIEIAQVTTELTFEKSPLGDQDTGSLVLRGKTLQFESVSVDRKELAEEKYTIASDQHKLILIELPDNGTICIKNKANINTDVKLEGLIRSTPDTLIAKCNEYGLETITFFIRDQTELIYFTTELSTPLNLYSVLIAPGKRIGETVNGEQLTITWRDIYPKTAKDFNICAAKLTSTPDDFVPSTKIDFPSIQIIAQHPTPRNTGRVFDAFNFVRVWFYQHFNINNKYSHYTVVSLPVPFNFSAQQQNVFIFDENTLLCSAGEDSEIENKNLLLNMASSYLKSQYQAIDFYNFAEQTNFAKEIFYKTHFDIPTFTLQTGYSHVHTMYLDFINCSLDRMQNHSMIEMPVDWIEQIQNILRNLFLTPKIRTYLLSLPDYYEIIELRTAINLEHLFDLYLQLHAFIAQSLKMVFCDIFLKIVSKTDPHYSVEFTREYDLLKICLFYMLLCEPEYLSEEILSHMQSDTSITNKANYFSVLMSSTDSNHKYTSQVAMNYMVSLHKEHVISTRLMLACIAQENTEYVYENIYQRLLSPSLSYYFKYVLVSNFAQHNFKRMHALNGKGYSLLADAIIMFDRADPNLSFKLLAFFDNWLKFDLVRKRLIHEEWKKIIRVLTISDQVYDKAFANLNSWTPPQSSVSDKVFAEQIKIKSMLHSHSLRMHHPANKRGQFIRRLAEEYDPEITASAAKTANSMS